MTLPEWQRNLFAVTKLFDEAQLGFHFSKALPQFA